jgi:hypothetical protein
MSLPALAVDAAIWLITDMSVEHPYIVCVCLSVSVSVCPLSIQIVAIP